jgi:hypothetical protein
MSHLRTIIRAAKVRGRVCPKCQALMLLCDITPVALAVEQHKFTCVECDHIEVRTVEHRNIAALAA